MVTTSPRRRWNQRPGSTLQHRFFLPPSVAPPSDVTKGSFVAECTRGRGLRRGTRVNDSDPGIRVCTVSTRGRHSCTLTTEATLTPEWESRPWSPSPGPEVWNLVAKRRCERPVSLSCVIPLLNSFYYYYYYCYSVHNILEMFFRIFGKIGETDLFLNFKSFL